MQYRLLGQTGVSVSSICFGTMTFGNEADESVSAAIFNKCRDAGVNFFDCADIYNRGESERILGQLLQGCRDSVVLTSKVNGPTGPDLNERGLSRRHIMLGIEESLKRLQTDRLDLYFLHMWDPKTPMEEPIRALDDLVRQGKILYPAVSNWSAWQIAKGLGIQTFRGLARFECMQPMYNLVKRQAEVELLPLAQAEGVSVIPYNPLGAGLLTGKYGTKRKPDTGRLVANKQYGTRFGDAAYYETTDRFVAHAQERGAHPATLAVSWVVSHPAVTSAIIGARNVEQLDATLAAGDLKMTAEWREEISKLSPAPPLPTDRSEEQK